MRMRILIANECRFVCPTCFVAPRLTYRRSSPVSVALVFLQKRINLSPFTKDFRGGEQLNESID